MLRAVDGVIGAYLNVGQGKRRLRRRGDRGVRQVGN